MTSPKHFARVALLAALATFVTATTAAPVNGAFGNPYAGGAAGAPGPQGPKGDTGAAGPAGATGASGPAGPQGSVGAGPGATGSQGPTGATGTTGATGAQGTAGTNGTTPSVTAGTTTTGAAGSSASVTRRSGSPDTAPIFDFTIPKGDTGATGAQGTTGSTGATGAHGHNQGPTGVTTESDPVYTAQKGQPNGAVTLDVTGTDPVGPRLSSNPPKTRTGHVTNQAADITDLASGRGTVLTGSPSAGSTALGSGANVGVTIFTATTATAAKATQAIVSTDLTDSVAAGRNLITGATTAVTIAGNETVTGNKVYSGTNQFTGNLIGAAATFSGNLTSTVGVNDTYTGITNATAIIERPQGNLRQRQRRVPRRALQLRHALGPAGEPGRPVCPRLRLRQPRHRGGLAGLHALARRQRHQRNHRLAAHQPVQGQLEHQLPAGGGQDAFGDPPRPGPMPRFQQR